MLFPIKKNVQRVSCVICKGICLWGETYVSEKIRNSKIRWNEHNEANKNFESAKCLARNIEHEFSWYILTRPPENTLKRRILEHTL